MNLPRLHFMGLRASYARASDRWAGQTARLIRDAGVYALAAAAAPLVSLLLAPFLTRYLTLTDYGILAVLLTAISLIAGITQLGLGSAFFRAYGCDFTGDEDRRRVLATAFILLCAVATPLMILCYAVAPIAAQVFFGDATRANLIVLSGLAILAQNLALPGFSWMRAESRATRYAVLSIVNLTINLGCTLILVGSVRLGIAGALIGVGAGYAAVCLLTLPAIVHHASLRLHREIAWSMLAFGVPQVGSVISFWVLQLSDRTLLSHFASYAETASYAVAYSLGSILSTLVLNPFNLAWPTTLFAVARRPDAARTFGQIFHWFGLVLLVAAYSFSLVGIAVLYLLFPPSYHTAAPVIPVIALSVAMYGAYLMFLTGTSIKRKTPLAAAFMTVAAIVNVGLNVFLIPAFGAMGAAAATLLAYMALAFVTYLANQRLYPIPFRVGRFVQWTLVSIVIFALSYWLAQRRGGGGGVVVMMTGLLLFICSIAVIEWRSAPVGLLGDGAKRAEQFPSSSPTHGAMM